MSITIKLSEDTKEQFDKLRKRKNESYDNVIKNLVLAARERHSDPDLSREEIMQIEKARERIKKGNFLTEGQTRKRLGI